MGVAKNGNKIITVQTKWPILIALILSNIVEQPTPEVVIEQGKLVGRLSVNGGHQVFEYLGIPYATVNDTNRFKAPFPPPNWQGTFRAVNEHHKCPQMFAKKFYIGEEDCLKLNVYSPTYASPHILVPVMVFIHGGGYTQGSSSRLFYDPVHLVKHGVIVVTLNYRVGALGFLCLGLESAPGNAGLKDQVAALRWVKKNIKAFGGDPDNITIFGESAGASSVAHLRLSKLAKGLFHKAVMQSGSSLPIWAITGDPIGLASRYAEELGYYTRDRMELIKIYRNSSLKSLVNIKIPTKKGSIVKSPIWFIPCVEAEIENVERVIERPPIETLQSGDYNHVPTILGYNNKEGLFLVAGENHTTLEEKEEIGGEHIIPTDIRYDIERTDMANKLKSLYFKNETINEQTILDLCESYSDAYFTVPVILEAEIISRTSSKPQYNYIFKYSGKRNILKKVSGYEHVQGACHADELFYMFMTNLHPYAINNEDYRIVSTMTTLWTNFAKFGNPTPATSALTPVEWEPSDSRSLKFLHIDKEMEIKPLEHTERLKFWNLTYTKHRRKFYPVGPEALPELYWV